MRLTVGYPAPIPVGHCVEVTSFGAFPVGAEIRLVGDPRVSPVVHDLDTGIRFTDQVHVRLGDGYLLTPREDLPVETVWRGTVSACTLVFVDAFDTQHTVLEIATDAHTSSDHGR